MAFPTKDGKRKFGSAYVARRYDSLHGAEENKGPKHSDVAAVKASPKSSMKDAVAEPKDSNKDVDNLESNESPEFEAGEQEGAEEQHPVVAQHGPAHKVEIDHSEGKHRVTSHHGDGHRHISDHEDAQAAHEEGGKLANVSLKTSGEAGDQQGAASEGDNDSIGEDGFMMPDLA